MNTQDVANRLVELCRSGEYMQAQNELYADNAVSLEPEGSPWQSAEGIKALNGKINQWDDMLEEVHRMEVSDPEVAGNFISLKMDNDVTFKGQGRTIGSEIAVYEVKDGKIVSEQFFYSM